MRTRSESATHEARMQEARYTAYEPIAHLNRKDRRTARGKQLVAEAETRALKAENDLLRERLEQQ